jgi:hypothetical protein
MAQRYFLEHLSVTFNVAQLAANVFSAPPQKMFYIEKAPKEIKFENHNKGEGGV